MDKITEIRQITKQLQERTKIWTQFIQIPLPYYSHRPARAITKIRTLNHLLCSYTLPN